MRSLLVYGVVQVDLDLPTAVAQLLRTARPIVVDLTPWTARRDARTLTAARAGVEERLRTGVGALRPDCRRGRRRN